jgi:gamma-glutamylcyclotransferase (GGCT)/AIG2-like uncharacterized protein YtfP
MKSHITRIFVYGTLLRGEANHHLLTGSEWVGPARTKPEYFLVDLGAYPAMVAGGQCAVWGEIYAVDVLILRRVDRLEGHPSFYIRTAIELEDGSQAETYVLSKDQIHGGKLIASGDWRARVHENDG